MKFISISLGIILSTSVAMNSYAHSISLTVDNIKHVKGVLMVALYNSSENYKSNTDAFAAKKIAVNDKKMIVDFTDVPAGDYALKLYQDENENGKLDMNAFGIPTEGYGFSNNGGSMGQPSFNEAKVVINSNVTLTINVR